jgi:predicted MFS family arabinose efflux permease
VGVLAAPIAGRVADRRGPHLLVLAGALLTAASWLCFGLSDALPWMVVGVVLLDFGAQVALVSNQAIIYALEPEARSRLNSLFMATMFAGGALGSAASTTAFARGGFGWVTAIGLAASLIALAIARR